MSHQSTWTHRALHTYPAMHQKDQSYRAFVRSYFSLSLKSSKFHPSVVSPASTPQNRIFLTPFLLLKPSKFHPFLPSPPQKIVSLYFSILPHLRPSLCTSEKMDVPEKLVRFRFHLIFAALAILLLGALVYLAPSFVSLLSYFWPLLLSTALFLAAVFLFHRVSPPESDASSHHKAGEQILDYVAGQPEVSAGIKDSEEEEEKNEDAVKSE